MRISSWGRKFQLVALGLLLLVLVALRRPSTPPIRGRDGRAVPESIAELKAVNIGGVEQWLLIRGQDQRNPILLFLHGGPGLALMPLAHEFQQGLEQDFVVVQWDMRGAGKSYHRSLSADALTEQQLVSDVHDVTVYLCNRFHKSKIYVVGHSFGTYLGLLAIQRYPELFHAYVGVGQLADFEGRANLAKRFILREATARGEPGSVGGLDNAARRHDLVVRYGGDLHGASSTWFFKRAALQAPEYSWFDYLRYVGGLWLYMHRPELFRPDITSRVAKVEVPIYFFLGRYDAIAPPELAEAYLQSLQAPTKSIIWFDHSAHWAFLEEPTKFREQLRAAVATTRSNKPLSLLSGGANTNLIFPF